MSNTGLIIIQIIFNLLSIFGFLMSGILFLQKIYKQKKDVSLRIYDYSQQGDIIQLYMLIQNNSSRPITVQHIALVSDSSFTCELIEKKIVWHGDLLFYSSPFPISLHPYGGDLRFFEFVDCVGIQTSPGKTLDFQIQTNLGPINKSLTLGLKGHYLNRK